MAAHVRPPRNARRAGHRPSITSSIIGVLGELLITAGVFLGCFVVWQLWWTDVEANQLHQEYAASLDWEAAPANTTPTEHRDAPPVMEHPPEGTIFGALFIPRFGRDYFSLIAEGDDKKKILDRIGAGHYPETAMPGDLGNFAIAGHRSTYGKVFAKIADLKEGDAIVVRTDTTWYVYRMESYEIVNPDQGEVIAPIPGTKKGDPIVQPTRRLITMTACHPILSAKQRYIAHGVFDYWMPTSEGVPKELTEAGVNIDVGVRAAQGGS